MSVKNKDKGATVSAPSRTITADEVRIENGVFVDETGDITQQVIDALPEGTEQVGFKITVELPSDEDTE